MIVKDNANEFAPNGFCSIARASENPTGENFLLNFDHYIRHGLLDFDVIVNTAPSPLLCSSACELLAGTRVIELASGDNFPRDMKVERLMALPAKAYPVSAGRILARSVLRMLGADGAL